MTFKPVGKGLLGEVGALKRSLSLPEESQCKVCGFWNVGDTEVRRILTDAGWSFDEAYAMVHCQCGTPEQKAEKIKQIERVKQDRAAMASRASFAAMHAEGFNNAVPKKDR